VKKASIAHKKQVVDKPFTDRLLNNSAILDLLSISSADFRVVIPIESLKEYKILILIIKI